MSVNTLLKMLVISSALVVAACSGVPVTPGNGVPTGTWSTSPSN